MSVEKEIKDYSFGESIDYLKKAMDQHCIKETADYYKKVLDHISTIGDSSEL